MGMGLILPSLPGRDEGRKRVVPYRIGAAAATFQETAPALQTQKTIEPERLKAVGVDGPLRLFQKIGRSWKTALMCRKVC
jgi:hypothetical protein